MKDDVLPWRARGTARRVAGRGGRRRQTRCRIEQRPARGSHHHDDQRHDADDPSGATLALRQGRERSIGLRIATWRTWHAWGIHRHAWPRWRPIGWLTIERLAIRQLTIRRLPIRWHRRWLVPRLPVEWRARRRRSAGGHVRRRRGIIWRGRRSRLPRRVRTSRGRLWRAIGPGWRAAEQWLAAAWARRRRDTFEVQAASWTQHLVFFSTCAIHTPPLHRRHARIRSYKRAAPIVA